MKIFFVSMGCAKNAADSEHLTGRLIALGHEIVDDASASQGGADVAIINTCGFIQDAVKENIDAILDLEKMKEDGAVKKIIVAGCLVNRYENELRKELPSVDLFVRSEEWDKVTSFLNNGSDRLLDCKRAAMPLNKNFWSRYLKISEGCDTLCSYCTIPSIRGRLRSVPLKNLIAEALTLCSAGARELCLVGQDLTVYGHDFQDGTNLKALIIELGRELPKGTWLRLLYMHPNRLNMEFIDFMMSAEKVLHYLDVPIQHIDPEILLHMNRPCPQGHIKSIFKYIREADPLFALRTTIMTGFPGESEKSFQSVIDFMNEIEFDRAGSFVYSPEDGTPAALLKNRVPVNIAEDRCSRLMETQAEISNMRSELFIDKELEILVEEVDVEAGEIWGRSYRDAPEVDGMVCVSGNIEHIVPGDFVKAKIFDCAENDLFGTLIT